MSNPADDIVSLSALNASSAAKQDEICKKIFFKSLKNVLILSCPSNNRCESTSSFTLSFRSFFSICGHLMARRISSWDGPAKSEKKSKRKKWSRNKVLTFEQQRWWFWDMQLSTIFLLLFAIIFLWQGIEGDYFQKRKLKKVHCWHSSLTNLLDQNFPHHPVDRFERMRS